MPAPRRPAHRRHPRSRAVPLVVVEGGGQAAPPLPAKLGGSPPLAATREAWDRLWSSPVAATFDLGSDLGALLRWASLLDERERALRAFRRQRLVAGSMGQPVASPMWQVVQGCDRELRALEDRLGLTPRARLQLGITFAEAGRSLDALSRLADDGDDIDDPRLVDVEGDDGAAW